VPPIDVAVQARRRGWLAALVQRVNAALDEPVQVQTTAALARRVTDVLGVQAGLMAASGELPAEVEVETLVAEASRELLSTGPIEALLADEEVQEIHIASHDQIIVTAARVQLVSEVAFTSEVALTRALDRLCASAGQPLLGDEVYVERRLARGVRLFAILPKPPGHGQIAVLRKPQRADLSLDDLVRLGTISHAMAGLLRLSITARANVLVTGSIGSGTTSFVAALASAGRSDDRVIVLQEDDEFILNQPHTVSLLLDDAPDVRVRTVRAAARMHPDRLVVGAFAGVVAAEIVDAIGDGIDGVLAAAHAPTIRQAMLRLPADLAATRIGLSPEAAREWLASAFDLAVEIARLPDGQHRVMRIVEPSIEANALVVRDVFAFTAGRTTPGGAIDGAFHASGLVPRIIEDLIAKGVTVDASIFKRTSSR
jgi:pilus assembly protein CpaF